MTRLRAKLLIKFPDGKLLVDTDADAIFSADPSNMVALFAHLRERYGSVAEYASAIGVPDEVVSRLRQAMLEPDGELARAPHGRPATAAHPAAPAPRLGVRPASHVSAGRIRSMAAARARSSTVSPPESCVVEHEMHLVPPDVDVGVVVRRLRRRTDPIDEGQGLGEVVQLDIRLQLVTDAIPEDVLFRSATSTSSGDSGRLSHGCVISSGRTAASNCSAVRKPSSSAASRNVDPSLWAFLATWADLSYPMIGLRAVTSISELARWRAIWG